LKPERIKGQLEIKTERIDKHAKFMISKDNIN
jgi:hypothetical protein